MKILCKLLRPPNVLHSRTLFDLFPRVGPFPEGDGGTGSGLIVVDEPRPVQLAYNSFRRTNGAASNEPVLPPLMILHGFYGRRQQFRELGMALHTGTQGRRKVYVLDARNHGESPHTLSHTIDDQVADVMQFMRTHNIYNTTLIGHSMGARTAMTIALKFPTLVTGCVVLDAAASPPTITGSTKLFFDALRSVAIPPHLNATDGRRLAIKQLRRILPHKIQRDFVLDNLIKTSKGSFDWQLNWRTLELLHEQNRKFLLPQNKQYLGPALFVKGSHSNELDPQQLLNTRRLFPTSRFGVIPNAGHLLHLEQPNTLQTMLLNFLKSTE